MARLSQWGNRFLRPELQVYTGKVTNDRDRVNLQRNYIVLLDDPRLQAVFQIKELKNKFCSEEKYYI